MKNRFNKDNIYNMEDEYKNDNSNSKVINISVEDFLHDMSLDKHFLN